jgi:hypothetical protein
MSEPALEPAPLPEGERERAEEYLRQLVATLVDRGLKVSAMLPALTVKNPAVAGQDPQGQQVLIRYYQGRGLSWCWVWPGLGSGERGAPTPEPEVLPMCPAEDIEEATRRITNVVRLRDYEPAESSADV